MVTNGCGFLSSAFARGALAPWHSYFKVRHKAKRRLGLQGVDLSAKPFFGLALDSWLALDSLLVFQIRKGRAVVWLQIGIKAHTRGFRCRVAAIRVDSAVGGVVAEPTN